MNKKILILGATIFLTVGCAALGNKLNYFDKTIKLAKVDKVLYFKPEVFPNIDEIEEPTDVAVYNAVSSYLSDLNQIEMVKINDIMPYDHIDNQYLKELCQNNKTDLVMIPKVKYFKVGFGKYVFSNQVIVSFKVYDGQGRFLIESSYDTYKGKARIGGKAESSIKIGVKGVLDRIVKEVKQNNYQTS